jgi:hypothetical protein
MADIDVEAVLAKLTSKNKLDLLAGKYSASVAIEPIFEVASM